MEDALLARMCESAQRHHLIDGKDAPAVLMVSGGSDSVAMARMVCACRQELGLGVLRILHINHCLRGDDSDSDEAFVVALAEELGVACAVYREDIAGEVERTGGNMEEIARHVRYARAAAELDALCDEVGAPRESGRILVAHTQDDRVETFFMRAIVGAGLGALSAMGHRNDRVIRPLLDFTRAELRQWLQEQVDTEPRWREDATNDETEHFRNFVRHRIVPVAEEYNPSLKATVSRNLDLLADENALLDQLAGEAFDATVTLEGDMARIDTEALSRYPLVLQRRVIRRAALDLLPEGTRLSASHVERLVQEGSAAGFSTLLPCGFQVRNEYGTLVLGFPEEVNDASVLARGAWLPVPGRLDLGDGRTLVAEVLADAAAVDFSLVTDGEAYVDLPDVDALWVCGPKPGMRMQPLGLGGHSKKVSDILGEAKVPARLRGSVPVVTLGPDESAETVWLCGLGVDERFRITSASQRIVKLYLA